MERYSGVGRIRLWQFLLEELEEGSECVEWTQKEEAEFKIKEPEWLAVKWGDTKINGRKTAFSHDLSDHCRRKFLMRVEKRKYRFGSYIKSVMGEERTVMEEERKALVKKDQYKLWQFALELLLKKSEVVQWTGGENFEFEVTQPESFVELWKARKNRNTITTRSILASMDYLVKFKFLERKDEKLTYRFLCDIEKLNLDFDVKKTVQLCQFIYELAEESEVIEWTMKETFEFRVKQVEAMAWKWGEKIKTMNNNYLTVDSIRGAIASKKKNKTETTRSLK
ncbi:hypothetical protein QZH41_000223 [Actinostola sp. cb2023]|nr:hypothetical protein QZH41_000223 [Actinostola sp. cb2023]